MIKPTAVIIAGAGLCLAFMAWRYESGEAAIKNLATVNSNVVVRYSPPLTGRRLVARVSIGRSRQDFEQTLPLLHDLRGLQTLQLWSFPLSSENMDAISKLNITNLHVTGCQTGTKELAPLANLQNLEILSLVKEAELGDEGVVQLNKLGSLREMDLSFSQVTGSCFANGFDRLEELRLTGCPVDDKSLKAIAKLRSLREVSISQTNVTGEGLIHLAGLHNLEQVGLPNGMPIEKILAARKAHILAKQKARIEGAEVPADSLSPFISFEVEANIALINAKQKVRRLPRPLAKKVRRAEMAIIWLVGRQNAPAVFDQLDDANFQAGTSKNDYTTSTRSLAAIFEADFGLSFDGTNGRPEGYLTPEKEQTIRAYLSGKLFPLPKESE